MFRVEPCFGISSALAAFQVWARPHGCVFGRRQPFRSENACPDALAQSPSARYEIRDVATVSLNA